MNILIIGGSGFIGAQLHEKLIKQNHRVIIKTRSKASISKKAKQHQWELIENYNELTSTPDCVICLAGSGIIDKRWNEDRKQELIESRTQPLLEIHQWLEANDTQVNTLLVGSAIGYYGYRPHPNIELTESDSGFRDFCHEVCNQLEECAEQMTNRFNHISALRTGVVLGKNGGAFSKMLPPAKLHLNGKMGHGKQWVSWIHIQDWIKAVEYIMSLDTPRKVYNLTGPNPVTNAEMSTAIGEAINKPFQLPVPALSLKLLLGESSQLLLGSQKVLPTHLLAAGFEFEYSDIESACRDLVN